MSETDRISKPASRIMLLAAVLFYITAGAVSIGRGLPDPERTSFYPPGAVVLDNTPIPGRFYRTGPLESFNPDEGAILNALSNMAPEKLDFNPKFFNYSSFFIYQVGAEIALLSKLNLIKLVRSKDYYATHPLEIRKMYLVGRFTALVYGLATVFLVYKIILFLSADRFRASLGVLLLCLMPNWVRECSFMLPNAPQTFFMTLAVYLTLKSGDGVDYKKLLLAAVAAGVSAGCKYPGGLIVLLPAGAYFFNSEALSWKKFFGTLLILALAPAVFLITTPYALLDFPSFYADIRFITRPWANVIPVPMRLYVSLLAMGPGILLVFLLSFYGFLKQPVKARRILLVWLGISAWVPILLKHTYMRYWISALPAMAAFAACFLNERLFRSVLFLWGPINFLYSLHFNVLTQSHKDPRIEASGWIEANIPAGSLIAARRMHFDMPAINNQKYKVFEEQGNCPSVSEWFILRERYPEPVSTPCGKFQLVKTFSNRPFLFGLNRLYRDVGDLAFTHVKINIYKQNISDLNERF